MGKFEEMNRNSSAVISAEIDTYLTGQGFEKFDNRKEFYKYYYKGDGFTTSVTIKEDSIYIYRRDSGVFVSDDYIDVTEYDTQDLESFKIFMNQVFEENFI